LGGWFKWVLIGLGVSLMIGVEMGCKLGAVMGVIKVRIGATSRCDKDNECAYSVRYIVYNL